MSIVSSNLYNIAGIHIPADAAVVIVRTEWNAPIVDKLQEGCLNVLDVHGVKHIIVTVPGAFEIPFTIKAYWDKHHVTKDKPVAFIALGCVLRGDTPHFDYVCKAVTDGIVQLNLFYFTILVSSPNACKRLQTLTTLHGKPQGKPQRKPFSLK